jgi:uncharacterized membrane protein YbhN (UPF0104 family)
MEKTAKRVKMRRGTAVGVGVLAIGMLVLLFWRDEAELVLYVLNGGLLVTAALLYAAVHNSGVKRE